MDKKTIHIALSGHRPQKLGGYDITTKEYQNLQKDLEEIIEHYLEEYDIVWGHSGLALGADTIWSKAIISMREKHPERVYFHAEIPMMSQSKNWFKKSDVAFWQEQVSTSDKQTVYNSSSPTVQVNDPS